MVSLTWAEEDVWWGMQQLDTARLDHNKAKHPALILTHSHCLVTASTSCARKSLAAFQAEPILKNIIYVGFFKHHDVVGPCCCSTIFQHGSSENHFAGYAPGTRQSSSWRPVRSAKPLMMFIVWEVNDFKDAYFVKGSSIIRMQSNI